jgi:nicotinate-nucleotide adenylyltransferase
LRDGVRQPYNAGMAHLVMYGGSFDPVHEGHLATCRAAREMLGAQGVLLIPAAVSPHKKGEPPGASAADRVAMLRLAVEGEQAREATKSGEVPRFMVDDREVRRGGTSYTIDTLLELRQAMPGNRFTLLIGADQLAKFHSWHRVAEILEHAAVAVLRRPGVDVSAGVAAIRQTLGAAAAAQIERGMLETPLVGVSSTEIRRRVRIGQSIEDMVPAPVNEYIHTHHLYESRGQTP